MVPNDIVVVDTETTGTELDSRICEFGAYGSTLSYNALVNPKIPIPPETSAIHHITDADVEGAASWEAISEYVLLLFQDKGVKYLAAHNAEFDKHYLGPDFAGFTWLCTYKIALRVWPNAPNHKNETLCYWKGIGDLGRSHSTASHSALHDARKTYGLLSCLLKECTIEQAIKWSSEPKFIVKLGFGKHKGKTWAEIDSGYLNWMCSQKDMDPDLIHWARLELQRRR